MPADSPIRRPGRGRTDGHWAPLRRKPKVLTENPLLYQAAGAATGSGVSRSRPAAPSARAGRPAAGTVTSHATADLAQLLTAAPHDAPVDAEALDRARRIAAMLSIPRARHAGSRRRGSGELTSMRYRDGVDDIDLDATLENLVSTDLLDEDDIVVRDRSRARRSVVLVVDVSGSMHGERARTAAATVGALCAELSRDDLGVIAFWSDAAVIAPLGPGRSAAAILPALLRIPARGLTNVGFPLQVAADQLAGTPAGQAQVLLLSDCVHNAGADPRPVAARLPRLDVLLDLSGEYDLDLARDLARAGHGRLATTNDHREVGPAVSSLFRR